MKVLLFDKSTKVGGFTNYGYGMLKYIKSCTVSEQLNGMYDAEIEVALADVKAKYITKWNIVWIDGQLFRIIDTVINDKEDTVKAYARHIYYDINYGFLEDVKITSGTAQDAMLKALSDEFKNFTVKSDITLKNSISFSNSTGAEAIDLIINRWGCGELKRDNFNIELLQAKGADKGVTFTIQKIEAMEVTETTEDIVTRLYPTGKDGITLDEKYVVIPNWGTVEYPPFHITREVNFSNANTVGALREEAKAAAETMGLSRVNIKINVSDLANTDMYAKYPQLMDIEVGDIVTVKHPKLDIRTKVKVIKKTHEKVSNTTTIELGQPLKSFFENVDNNNVKTQIPSLDHLKEGFFYYSNGLSETVKSDEVKTIASLDFSTGEDTNLMLYTNVFFSCDNLSEIELTMFVNNSKLNLSPKMTCQSGNHVLSYTYPLVAVTANTNRQLELKLKSTGGTVDIEPENIQIMIKGQNLNGGIGESIPRANVLETIRVVDIVEENKIDTSVIINKQEVTNLAFTENLSFVNVTSGMRPIGNIPIVTVTKVADETYFNSNSKHNYLYDEYLIDFENKLTSRTIFSVLNENKNIDKIQGGTILRGVLTDSTKYESLENLKVEVKYGDRTGL